ncbi:MAG: YceI family protein [Thermoanaerobaculia bacterium]
MRPIEELPTPAVLVDLDVLERNIARMAERARAARVKLRPHAKTHKVVEIGRMQIALGAAGLSLAKVGEAEVFADAGFEDLFLAYPTVGGDRTRRLLALSDRLRLAVGADSVEGAHTLSEEVSFQVRHLVSKVRGRFTDFDVALTVDPQRPEEASVVFAVEAASIDTDLPDRDQHLRSADFFDAENFPRILFQSSRVTPRGANAYEVDGTLTIRGVSRKIRVPVSFLGFITDPWGNEKAGFEAQLQVDRRDFGMVWNALLDNGGAILGDEVSVTVNLEMVRQPQG